MSLLSAATWTAIYVLVIGSIAVFVWFLHDARGVLRASLQEPPPEIPDGEGSSDG